MRAEEQRRWMVGQGAGALWRITMPSMDCRCRCASVQSILAGLKTACVHRRFVRTQREGFRLSKDGHVLTLNAA